MHNLNLFSFSNQLQYHIIKLNTGSIPFFQVFIFYKGRKKLATKEKNTVSASISSRGVLKTKYCAKIPLDGNSCKNELPQCESWFSHDFFLFACMLKWIKFPKKSETLIQ